ncbi:MAG: hypothetical protein HZY76_21840 [Anaerolineae bacterium]|nr:MAG: hypothetical protein HZY76_21840 [Anaerolineae bacterium]
MPTVVFDKRVTAEDWLRAETLEAALMHPDAPADDEIAGLVAVSQRFTGLAQVLAPPSLGLVRRVEHLAVAPVAARTSWPIRRLWPTAAALAAVVLLVALTAFGPGRGALAALYARLNLGNIDVSVTPDSTPAGPRFTTAYRESLASLDAARRRVSFPCWRRRCCRPIMPCRVWRPFPTKACRSGSRRPSTSSWTTAAPRTGHGARSDDSAVRYGVG